MSLKGLPLASILLVGVRKKVSWGDIFWKTTLWMLVLPDLKRIRPEEVLRGTDEQDIHIIYILLLF